MMQDCVFKVNPTFVFYTWLRKAINGRQARVRQKDITFACSGGPPVRKDTLGYQPSDHHAISLPAMLAWNCRQAKSLLLNQLRTRCAWKMALGWLHQCRTTKWRSSRIGLSKARYISILTVNWKKNCYLNACKEFWWEGRPLIIGGLKGYPNRIIFKLLTFLIFWFGSLLVSTEWLMDENNLVICQKVRYKVILVIYQSSNLIKASASIFFNYLAILQGSRPYNYYLSYCYTSKFRHQLVKP